jgi:chemotaxis protein methyltransferase CheR
VQDIELRLLLEGVFRRYGYDFREYDPFALKKRILECAREEKVRTLSGLQEKLLHEPECFDRLVTAIAASVSSVFDDARFYKSFRTRIAPALKNGKRLRLWLVGCGTGEDVYSTAVMLREEGLEERTRLYATEIHEAPLKHAAAGSFPLDRLQGAEMNYRAAGGAGQLADYYTVEGGRGVFRAELKRNVVFAAHNLATDASFNEFDVILCRNVLSVLSPKLQGRVHSLVYESLAPEGYLALGRGENLKPTPFEPRYAVLDRTSSLFQKLR